MKNAQLPQKEARRCSDMGAILIVVLIVMIALLGLGMTGLFLTSGSIQMNTNINLRNQALVVAEAGLERARGVLNNPNWIPPIPNMLAGSNSSSGDEIPTSVNDCQGGTLRGAILVDQITPGCTGSPTPATCVLRNVTYLPVNRSADLPSSAGSVPSQAMGKYTVYIRQDQADCRMGNFVCDNSPVPGSTSGTGGTGGSSGTGSTVITCTAPSGAPVPNGVVIIRSEGVASDNRTRVVLEVTLAPGQGTNKATNTPLAALCASGANGCDDNSSVQNGIVVNSPIKENPPTYGGAGGSAGGAGGAVGTGGVFTPPTGTAGGSMSTGGAIGSGGATGTGGSGSGGSTTCSQCNAIATMGITGVWNVNWGGSPCGVPDGSRDFSAWLAQHSSKCTVANIEITNTTITPALLAPFKTIIVLDLFHTPADKATRIANVCAGKVDQWDPYYTSTQRQLAQSEKDAVVAWVNKGGGLATTIGIQNTPEEPGNVNGFLQPFGLTYSTNWSYVRMNVTPANLAASNFSTTPPIASAITAGVTSLVVNNAIPIMGWSNGAEIPVPSNLSYLATFASWSGYALGVAVTASPHTASSGRIVVWADEWITYDAVWGDSSEQANTFWQNTIAWLSDPSCAGR